MHFNNTFLECTYMKSFGKITYKGLKSDLFQAPLLPEEVSTSLLTDGCINQSLTITLHLPQGEFSIKVFSAPISNTFVMAFHLSHAS